MYKFNAEAIIRELKRWLDTSSPVFVPRLSFIFAIVTASLGIYIGVAEKSLTVATNGFISATDVVNALLMIAAVDRSVKQADFNFNYGYGKYESLAILSSALLLLIVSINVLFEAIHTLGQPSSVDNYTILASFSAFSLIAMLFLHRVQVTFVKKFHLPMLQYDTAVLKSDIWIEVGVLINILMGAALHYYGALNIARLIDSITAILLVITAMRIPVLYGREALNQLLDKTVAEDIQMDLLTVIVENIDSFCEFKSVHTRQSGKDLFIEIDLVMPFDYTLEQNFVLENKIKDRVLEKFPTSIFRIYATPCPQDCMKNGKCFCPVKS
ncbi:MAG: cation diffusion facilitator family transporter [Ignavibacteria bacterium]|nr:cation diffusion facilitator family transporter [Ignavibacteria bacterium]